MPNKKSATARLLTIALGMGLPIATEQVYEARTANKLLTIIQIDGEVLNQYWHLRQARETEAQFVDANQSVSPSMAAERYNQIMQFGDAMTDVIAKGVRQSSPLAVHALLHDGIHMAGTTRAEYRFPDAPLALSPLSSDTGVFLLEESIYRQSLASMNYIRLTKGEPVLAGILYENTLARHNLAADPYDPSLVKLDIDSRIEAAAIIDECREFNTVLRKGANADSDSIVPPLEAVRNTAKAAKMTERDAANLTGSSNLQQIRDENQKHHSVMATDGLTI